MLNDSETINMPQIPMYTGGCLLKIMYLCRIIQMTQKIQIKIEI